MCKCTPEIRTPFCGKLECKWPETREIVYAKETMKIIFNEGFHLLKKHYGEVAHYQDIPLDPDMDSYYQLENMGIVHVFCAREAGELIGYAIYFVKHNIHYKNSKQATEDVIFVHPKKRGLGFGLLTFADVQLREMGVQVVYHHVKINHDWGPALEKQGYQLIEKMYGKRLDKGVF